MNTNQIYGIVLGGFAVSALGGVAEYVRENEVPKLKSLVRDFFIGAIMVLFLLQLIPESVGNVLTYLPSVSFMTDTLKQVGGSTSMDPDLQIGPARF